MQKEYEQFRAGEHGPISIHEGAWNIASWIRIQRDRVQPEADFRIQCEVLIECDRRAK